MSLDSNNISCVRCKAYLFDEDDIVYCPICGAPHHRECYLALGHCALEELHGTENEYKPVYGEPKAQKEEKSEQQKPHRHNQNHIFDGPDFQMFDLYGGIDKDYKFEEDVDANDVKNFVVSNTHRYIPKFVVLNELNKTSWNWLAFLFPSAWMFSRKMFKSGFITGILTIVATLMSFPFSIALNNLGVDSTATQPNLIPTILNSLPDIGLPVLLISVLAVIINLAIRIISGIYGDYWYKKHVLATVKEINKESKDIEESYRKKGGVNIFFFFITYMALQYIPLIIMNFIS